MGWSDGIMWKRNEGELLAIPGERTESERRNKTFEQKVARLRVSPEERAGILASKPPFDYDAWMQQAGPPTPEELAEMEELLREREEERVRSLARQEERSAILDR